MKRDAVLVIRPHGPFSSTLRDRGLDVVDLELVRTEPLDDLSAADETISLIENYDGLFFTSPAAASVFGKRMAVIPAARPPKMYALGERAKVALEGLGFAVTHVGGANTAADLLAAFDNSEFIGKRFLYVRGETSMRTIPETLGKMALVDEVAVYRTAPVEPPPETLANIRERLRIGEFLAACFFSPSGVDRFEKLFSAVNFDQVTAAAIGETTATRARAAGFETVFVSTSTDAVQFARELAENIKNIE